MSRPVTPAVRNTAGGFASRPSQAEELATLKKVADYMVKNPAEGREMLVRAGIYTPTGQLAKAYGG